MTTTTPEDSVLAEVQAYCGWHIAPNVEQSYVLDGTCATSLQLPTLMMTDLISLAVDGVPVDVSDDTAVQWSSSGFMRSDNGFGWKLRTIDVTIEHGYDSIPLDVQAVMDRAAGRSDVGSSYTRVGMVMHALGKDGVPVGLQLTDSELAVLAPYRLPPRP
jgi:hypothetical protein